MISYYFIAEGKKIILSQRKLSSNSEPVFRTREEFGKAFGKTIMFPGWTPAIPTHNISANEIMAESSKNKTALWALFMGILGFVLYDAMGMALFVIIGATVGNSIYTNEQNVVSSFNDSKIDREDAKGI